jgi:hypothetical protein
MYPSDAKLLHPHSCSAVAPHPHPLPPLPAGPEQVATRATQAPVLLAQVGPAEHQHIRVACHGPPSYPALPLSPSLTGGVGTVNAAGAVPGADPDGAASAAPGRQPSASESSPLFGSTPLSLPPPPPHSASACTLRTPPPTLYATAQARPACFTTRFGKAEVL